jgi:hypothetical protein
VGPCRHFVPGRHREVSAAWRNRLPPASPSSFARKARCVAAIACDRLSDGMSHLAATAAMYHCAMQLMRCADRPRPQEARHANRKSPSRNQKIAPRDLVGFDPAEAGEMEACLATATASRVVAGYFVATTLTSAEILEPVRRQGHVHGCARDRAMAQVLLNRPRVVTFGGERITAGMAKHVRVGLQFEAEASMGRALDHSGKSPRS